MIRNISKEKKILIESYDKRNLNYKNTKSIMDKMMNFRLGELKKSRNEEYDSKVSQWKKQTSFDISKINQTSESPTSKSIVRPFRPQTLQERRISQWELELEQIKQELE